MQSQLNKYQPLTTILLTACTVICTAHVSNAQYAYIQFAQIDVESINNRSRVYEINAASPLTLVFDSDFSNPDNEWTIEKNVDNASIELDTIYLSGQSIESATIDITFDNNRYNHRQMWFILHNVTIKAMKKHYSLDAQFNMKFVDRMTLSFRQIEWIYTVWPDHSERDVFDRIHSGWNFDTNTELTFNTSITPFSILRASPAPYSNSP